MSTAEQQRGYRAAKALAEGRTPGRSGRPVSQPCGTVAAYKRHRRWGEEPCEDCRLTYNAYQTELNRARRQRLRDQA